MIIFQKLEHFSLPISILKIKSVGHATICGTVIFSCNSNIVHSYSYLETWEKGLTRLKTLKKIIFHNFEHSSLSTSLRKQKKNNWARNYMWHSLYFVHFQHKLLLDLSKKLKKRTQTAKKTSFWEFLASLSTCPCRPRSQTKIKTIGHATAFGTLNFWS